MGSGRRFILDCSVSAAWCFSDENDPYTTAVLDSFTNEFSAMVPPLWHLEMVNVFQAAESRKRITRRESNHFIDLIDSLPIETLRDYSVRSDRELLELCRLYRLTSYDAIYLYCALERSLPLSTKDRGLKSACREAGVPIFMGEG